MRWQGIIFDLDGVICSTDEYHYRAWKSLADKIGIPFDREKNNRLRGVSRMESLEIILEGSPAAYTPEEKEAFASEKNEMYRELLLQMGVKDLDPEIKHTLDILRDMRLKLAIGSSSKNAPLILRQIGLDNYFDAVCDGNSIQNSKPHPEVFLKAAEMLGLEPEKCLVVEDAVAGAEAAHAGNMKCACVGDASKKGAGDFNLRSVTQALASRTLSITKETISYGLTARLSPALATTSLSCELR